MMHIIFIYQKEIWGGEGMSKSEIENILKDVICEKTGYPIEIIENSCELEADLGIDSLKQMIIYTELYHRLYMEQEEFDREQTSALIVGINTVQDVIDYTYNECKKHEM